MDQLYTVGFDQPNPVVKDPAPGDTLKRATAGSMVCRPCSRFTLVDPEYKKMTSKQLVEHLQDDANQAEYNDRREAWCSQRREGKRVAKAGRACCVRLMSHESCEQCHESWHAACGMRVVLVNC